jgi:hypothetical protein
LKILILLIALIVAPAFGEPLSDRTGLKSSFDIDVDGKTFVVETVANFDIRNVSFEDNKLVFNIVSSLKDNLGEIQIPQNVTKGDLHFYLDNQTILPKILQNQKISFVTLEFTGNGTHKLEMTSDFVSASQQPAVIVPETTNMDNAVATVAAVIGIVVAIGVGSTIAFYMKRKKSQ